MPQINNLGGVGPEGDATAEVMRFERIGFLDNVPFDLLITNSTPVYYGSEACEAGCDGVGNGVFIEMPVQVKTNYSFSMRFVDPASGDRDVTLPAFFLSGFDFDSSPGGTDRERMSARADTGTFTFSAGSEIAVSGTDPRVGIEFADMGSGPVPNPTDPLDLTPEQLAVTITLLFQNTSSFSLNVAYDDDDASNLRIARNVFFAFTPTQLLNSTC